MDYSIDNGNVKVYKATKSFLFGQFVSAVFELIIIIMVIIYFDTKYLKLPNFIKIIFIFGLWQETSKSIFNIYKFSSYSILQNHSYIKSKFRGQTQEIIYWEEIKKIYLDPFPFRNIKLESKNNKKIVIFFQLNNVIELIKIIPEKVKNNFITEANKNAFSYKSGRKRKIYRYVTSTFFIIFILWLMFSIHCKPLDYLFLFLIVLVGFISLGILIFEYYKNFLKKIIFSDDQIILEYFLKKKEISIRDIKNVKFEPKVEKQSKTVEIPLNIELENNEIIKLPISGPDLFPLYFKLNKILKNKKPQ